MGEGNQEDICIKEATDAGDLKQDPFLQNLNDRTLLPSIYNLKIVSIFFRIFRGFNR